MNTQQGLEPVQEKHQKRNQRQSQDRMTPQQMQREIPLQPSAAGTNRHQGVPNAPQDDRLGQLADSLAMLSPTVGRYGEMVHKQKVERQEKMLPQMIEELKTAQRLGDLEAVRNGELFPELVPAVRRTLQEQMGREAGRRVAGELAEEMLSNTNLRHDTEARNAYVQERMTEILGELPEGYELWNSGYLQSVQGVVEAKEQQLLHETAEKHRQMLERRWGEEALGSFETQGWEGVATLDFHYDASGPVSRQVRNDKLVEHFIQEAVRQGDYKYLEIPERYLNRDRAAAVEEAYKQIYRDNQSIARAEADREKMFREQATDAAMDDVIYRMAAGEPVNVADYFGREGVDAQKISEYVRKWQDLGTTSPSVSRSNQAELRHNLLVRASVETTSVGGRRYEPITEEQVRQEIMDAEGLNMKERQALLGEVETILDGVNVQRHPIVRDSLDDAVLPEARALSNSFQGALVNYSDNLYRPIEFAKIIFNNNLNANVESYMSRTGSAPPLHEVREFAKEASEVTMNELRAIRENPDRLEMNHPDSPTTPPAQSRPSTRDPLARGGAANNTASTESANRTDDAAVEREMQQRGFQTSNE